MALMPPGGQSAQKVSGQPPGGRQMRMIRVAAAATAFGVAAAVTGSSIMGAGAATTGKGTSLTKTTVLGLQLGPNGSVLDLSLASDTGRATIDAAQQAASDLTILSVASQAL